MKRKDLLGLIRQAAKSAGLDWEMVQTSGRGNHEKWRLGTNVQVSIPRHREINEITATEILKATQEALGAGWWK
ncbi:MAG: hypothetical protein ABSD78_18815 [Acidimicrobiales bacterium]